MPLLTGHVTWKLLPDDEDDIVHAGSVFLFYSAIWLQLGLADNEMYQLLAAVKSIFPICNAGDNLCRD